ncbi:MAG: hypothetical protein ACKO2A_10355, partial [Acidimicrobiaceae bacterium]
ALHDCQLMDSLFAGGAVGSVPLSVAGSSLVVFVGAIVGSVLASNTKRSPQAASNTAAVATSAKRLRNNMRPTA